MFLLELSREPKTSYSKKTMMMHKKLQSMSEQKQTKKENWIQSYVARQKNFPSRWCHFMIVSFDIERY